MIKHRIALVGFGTVAQGLCHILHKKRTELLEQHDFDFKIVSVTTRSRGTMYHSQGLNLSDLLELALSKSAFSDHLQDWNTETMIRQSNATVVVELSTTDLNSGEPAISHCKAAFETGKHIVTGNKGPAALAYSELKLMANQNNCHFLNEATVLSGTPVFSLVQKSLVGNHIHKIRGILNGTTNFILSEMEAEATYSQALDVAETMGYLEADKAADIEGHDAQAKLTILANILMGLPLHLKDVKRSGIEPITVEAIQAAKQQHERWKLIATINVSGDAVHAEVKPEKVPFSDPLSQVMGTANAITFSTDLLGEVTIAGPGAGSIETGYSILSDLLTINRGNVS
ncbi:MAG: homoserine dehydrogenase [Candidatus Marinimicrobia bacterium]|nr:homoserine dehydrogenase [Candidatus Neomarinimicrobiota bacterium]